MSECSICGPNYIGICPHSYAWPANPTAPDDDFPKPDWSKAKPNPYATKPAPAASTGSVQLPLYTKLAETLYAIDEKLECPKCGFTENVPVSSAYAALEKENADLRAEVDKLADELHDKELWCDRLHSPLQAELAAEKERADEWRRKASGERNVAETLEYERDEWKQLAKEARAELKQTDERAAYWVAEAARLRGELERIAAPAPLIGSGKTAAQAYRSIAREALERGP
jgi:hypothetical protein